jgi:hypothetical protein
LINLNGKTVTTAGDQTYRTAVMLGVDDTLTATGTGGIDFVSTVDGAQNLVTNSAVDTTFGAAVDIAYRLERNEYRGRSTLQLGLSDFRVSA